MTKWEDIADVLTPEGVANIKPGHVLMFNYEGSPLHLKIKRKANGKVWAERVQLLTEAEMMEKLKQEEKQGE